MFDKKIADVDASALYPSAMHYMDGFLEGLPNVLNGASYEFSKHKYGYLIITKFIKRNKRLDFPLTSKLN